VKERIINMTPHPIVILDNDMNVYRVIESSGQTVRLTMDIVRKGEFDGIPISKTEFGKPVGLPELDCETYLIVSQLVKNAFPLRHDLVVPAEVIRDEKGDIMGCRSLGI